MKKPIIFLIFLAISVIIILLCIKNIFNTNIFSSDSNKVFTPQKTGVVPSLEIENFKLIQTIGNEKQWELLAKSALEYEDQKEVFIKDTLIYFFKKNKIVLTVKSKEGIVDLRTKDIIISGNVDASSSDGLNLKTESLRWLSADGKMVTEDPIVLTRAEMIIEGKGMEADIGLGKLKVKEQARVQVLKK